MSALSVMHSAAEAAYAACKSYFTFYLYLNDYKMGEVRLSLLTTDLCCDMTG